MLQPAWEPCKWRCLGDVCAPIESFGEVITKEYLAGFTTISNKINIASLVFGKCKVDGEPLKRASGLSGAGLATGPIFHLGGDAYIGQLSTRAV